MRASVLAHYSEALDEIYRLRMAFAYEAQQLNDLLVHSHSALSDKRRAAIYQAMQRMRAAARGNTVAVYHPEHKLSSIKLIEHDIPLTLTRGQWEQ